MVARAGCGSWSAHCFLVFVGCQVEYGEPLRLRTYKELVAEQNDWLYADEVGTRRMGAAEGIVRNLHDRLQLLAAVWPR